MTTISNADFLNDLKAAIIFGWALEVETAEKRAVRNLLTVKQIDAYLSEPAISASAISALDQSQLPPRLIAAEKFAKITGSMSVVFEALSVRLDSQRWSNRVLSRTGWYLLLLVLTMVLGLALFYHFSNPVFENLRSDMRLESVAKYVPPVDPTAWVLPTILVALFLGVVGWLFTIAGGLTKIVDSLGGQAIARQRQTSVALDAIGELNQAGIPMKEAVKISCDLVAADPETRERINAALSGAKEATGIAAWADSMAAAARERMTKIELWLPLVTTTLIGGVLATLYCLLIFNPLISILYELASTSGER